MDSKDEKPNAKALPDSTVKVIVAGLPRTGTVSISTALEHLGFGPVHHYLRPLYKFFLTRRAKNGARAITTTDTTLRRHRLRKLFDGYGAVADLPGSAVVDDLIAIYPDAKVILTLRSHPQSWLRSIHTTTTFPILATPTYRLLTLFLRSFYNCSILIQTSQAIHTSRSRTRKKSSYPSIELYADHADWVRGIVPRERLLEFEPSMGWGPLCEFLGVEEVPGTEYPRVNDRVAFNAKVYMSMALGIVSWIGVGWMVMSLLSFALGL